MLRTLFFKRVAGVASALAALAMAPARASEPVELYINNAAPYSYLENGQETGLVHDLLDSMAMHAGVPSVIRPLPFKRLAMQLATQQNALGAVWRQPEVEQSYIWMVKLLDEPVVLAARQDSTVNISSVAAARTLRVGVLLGSPAEIIARRMGFAHIETATSTESNVIKLRRGRIDAWLAVPSVIAAAQQRTASTMPVRFGPPIEHISMYLSCAAPCKASDLDRWKSADLAMKQDGSHKRIFKKYARIALQAPAGATPASAWSGTLLSAALPTQDGAGR